jgi:hypothetical protein
MRAHVSPLPPRFCRLIDCPWREYAVQQTSTISCPDWSPSGRKRQENAVMSPASSETQIPVWVPEAARRCINELRKTPLGMDDEIGGGLLTRLATYEVMKTEVWGKLPSVPNDFEANIITWAFRAFTVFPALRRPIPKKKSKIIELAGHQAKHPPLTDPGYVRDLTLLLWEKIFECKDETISYWDRFWEGEKSITPDKVLNILDQLMQFYARMDEEYQRLLASLPKVTRWNSKAAQKFFTDYLSRCMRETYGQPLDSIVATLTEVAFDLQQGVEAETIRGRPRMANAPEKSNRKSR